MSALVLPSASGPTTDEGLSARSRAERAGLRVLPGGRQALTSRGQELSSPLAEQGQQRRPGVGQAAPTSSPRRPAAPRPAMPRPAVHRSGRLKAARSTGDVAPGAPGGPGLRTSEQTVLPRSSGQGVVVSPLSVPEWCRPVRPAHRSAPLASRSRQAASRPGVSEASVGGAVPPGAALPVAVRRSVMAVGAVLGAGLLVFLLLVSSAFLGGPQAGDTMTVQAGQSLWEIAQSTGTEDVSATVAEIVELNDLTSSHLEAGQTLVLPVQ